MKGFGFSINNLSLFGIVLAIGIVVDDAIVVVEAIEHHIEDGLSPRDAARKAMTEVGGALVAIALVLCSVFIPTAFIAGITAHSFVNSRSPLQSRLRSPHLIRSHFPLPWPHCSSSRAARRRIRSNGLSMDCLDGSSKASTKRFPGPRTPTATRSRALSD